MTAAVSAAPIADAGLSPNAEVTSKRRSAPGFPTATKPRAPPTSASARYAAVVMQTATTQGSDARRARTSPAHTRGFAAHLRVPQIRTARFSERPLRSQETRDPSLPLRDLLWSHPGELRAQRRDLQTCVEHRVSGIEIPGHFGLIVCREAEAKATGRTRLVDDEAHRVDSGP